MILLATALGLLAGVLLGAVVARRRQSASADGGRMWATNNSDAGATFHVVLPYAPTESVL